MRPPFVWPRGSLPSFLSFALQLALDVQVPVGSLLPNGSHPSRWGHPCGVAAGEVLDRDEGLVCFSFPSGLILRDKVTLWVETVLVLILDRNEEFSESLLRWFRAFTVASPFRGASWLWASAPVRTGGLFFCPSANVLRDEVTLWVKCVGRFPLDHERRLSLVLSPRSFQLGFAPLSEASLSAL